MTLTEPGVVMNGQGVLPHPQRVEGEIRSALVGDIVATREVVVARGATFNGRSHMHRPERGAHATALRDSEA